MQRSADTNYCNNCSKRGHSFYQCNIPITSLGVVVFREHPALGRQYLMIRRKDTLGFIDFMRGKYAVCDRGYILNMVRQMTDAEKAALAEKDFDALWTRVWGCNSCAPRYNADKELSRDKFGELCVAAPRGSGFPGGGLDELLTESRAFPGWTEAEWGFPKGRRNFHERDFDCAVREMAEETGYAADSALHIKNVQPFEEVFVGSNYRAYMHRYFLMRMDYARSLVRGEFERGEVSMVDWKSHAECVSCIRSYNAEKRAVIDNVHTALSRHCLAMISEPCYGGGGAARAD